MASSINSILGIGAGALYAHQNSIQTTGNNIANVDTEGYSRQGVRYETNPSLNASPGQIGQGVRAVEVYRMFNRFVEKAYISKASDASRWSEQAGLLSNIDALVYESDTVPGVGSTLNQFFKGWQTLSNNGTLQSSREALLSDAETLATFIREQEATLRYMQQQMDGLIQTDVNRANQLIQEIAQLNSQINQFSEPGKNNPNSLLDQRDLKARQLAEIVDIDIVDKGEGHYTVSTKSGMTLVDEGNGYTFEFHGPEFKKNLAALRPGEAGYQGGVNFAGSDEYEYTLEILNGGTVNGGATFKVSLDGGKSWLCNDGTYRTASQVRDLTAGMTAAEKAASGSYFKSFDANDGSNPAFVKDLEISFDAVDPATGLPTNALREGDQFTIMPKSGVYWNSPTTGLINVTPQTLSDGTQNPRRLTGGTLTAYFEFRDNLVGEYRDRLDSFTSTLIWEVNRVHSQGVGLEKLTSVLGDYQVKNSAAALNGPYSGLKYGDKIQDGTFSFALYDANGEPVMDGGKHVMVTVEDFKATDSLDDMARKINEAAGNHVAGPPADQKYLTASVIDGKLHLQTKTDPDSVDGGVFSFGVVNDSSGALAALGINTFFKGEGAGDIAVRDDIVKNLNLINAGAVNGGGEGNSGDTITALEMSKLATKKISFTHPATGKVTEQTLLANYSAYVTRVGADTQSAKYNATLHGTMASDLRSQQDSNSGVNLDEEMTNLVRFQNSYKAAAKLITTADEMLQTIIGLKQ